MGSAARLKGSCCLINIYLRDQESFWPDELKHDIVLRMEQAVNFIINCASEYNINVSITQRSIGLDVDVEYPGAVPIDMFENIYWSEDAFTPIGYLNGNNFIKDIKKQFNAEQAALVFHINKPGRSYNISYCYGSDKVFYAERCVMFSSYDGNIPTYASSYAHEILHCFGAGELYFPFDSTKERYTLAGNFFPNDVMFRVDSDINKISIGEYTAYRIGWLKSLKKKYWVFEDFC
jgi:hypothetical protein